MSNHKTTTIKLTALCIAFALTSSVFATSEESYDHVNLMSRKLNGPRLGMSYLLGDDLPIINGKQIGPTVSQFGWHFEWIIRPEGGGPAFITQVVPFLGGVEHSLLIPSVSTVFGIRLPFGLEFGMGPHLSTRFSKEEWISPSLVAAIGQSINFSGVSIPLNLAVTTSKHGNAVAFVFGYAIPSGRE
ncbi:MAG: hypothetical protein JW863_18470 [Chitinispirillaceae bacterium]|nr:hypothetical protein [Chitinispirillaceae bacterium]